MVDHPPRVSVLMPAYNAQGTLSEAVTSILTQDFDDFECVIVDDGSTDRTPDILKDFARKDNRVRIISRPNTGIVGALNDGLALCRGEYIARMDADDIAYSSRLREQVAFLDSHADYVGVGSWVQYLDPDGDPIWTWKMSGDPQAIEAGLLEGNISGLVHPAMMLRRSAVETAGSYRQECIYVEDFDLFLRMSQLGKLSAVQKCLLGYRQTLTSINATRNRSERIAITNRILAEPRARHGLPPKTLTPAPVSPEGTLLEWVELALLDRNYKSARKSAFRLFKLRPFGPAFWRAKKMIISAYFTALRVKLGGMRSCVSKS